MKNFIFTICCLLCVVTTNAQTKNKTPFVKGDVWIGNYECHNEEREMKLVIEEVQGNIIRAKYVFLEGKGSFELIGKYENNEFTFHPTKWIKHPENYVTLGLHGYYLSDPKRLIGNTFGVLTYSEGGECTGFHLEKQE